MCDMQTAGKRNAQAKARNIYRTAPANKVLEGNLCASPTCASTFQDTLKRKKSPFPQTGTNYPSPSGPPSSSFSPTKTRPDPCPASFRRPGPASSRCLPGLPAAKRENQIRTTLSPGGLAQPAPRLPTSHTQEPLAPPGGGGGSGSRVRANPTKWRRPLEPRRYRALSRAPARARVSAHCFLPLRLAGSKWPILKLHTNDRAARGRGLLVALLLRGGQPALSPSQPITTLEVVATPASEQLWTPPLPREVEARGESLAITMGRVIGPSEGAGC
ncbi:uncharacterized protein LOC108310156 [Cebus imitator]|uniref:uncharacterized protein LOC108310156 n=1 Tax=Cebus imitator TaxID=2715852 RepID=UPI00080A601D|nr:uncharacterized protein LOC108310156 [Cebus imitator]